MGNRFCWAHQSFYTSHKGSLHHYRDRIPHRLDRSNTDQGLYNRNNNVLYLWEYHHLIQMSKGVDEWSGVTFCERNYSTTHPGIHDPSSEEHPLSPSSQRYNGSFQQNFRTCSNKCLQCAAWRLGSIYPHCPMGLSNYMQKADEAHAILTCLWQRSSHFAKMWFLASGSPSPPRWPMISLFSTG